MTGNPVIRGGEIESSRRIPAILAAGLLAFTGAVEVQSAIADVKAKTVAAEIQGNQDPFSKHMNEGLREILSRLETFANHHSKNIQHTTQNDGYGGVFDRYTYAVPTTPSKPSGRYDQIVCLVPKGGNLPIGCEVLVGVKEPFAPGQQYAVGQFFVVGGPNQYSLENILPGPSGVFEQHYFIKEGNSYQHRYELGNGVWESEVIQKQRLETVYDHFLHNVMIFLKPIQPKGPVA